MADSRQKRARPKRAVEQDSDGAHCTAVARPSDLLTLAGSRLGVSPWLEITQEAVDQFARVTLDEQWIHVDRRRAAAGPFKTTIAHGYFVLSLCAYFAHTTLTVERLSASINYGLDRVRFTSPVPVGSRLRAQVELEAADAIDGGVQIKELATIERQGADKPACVATLLARLYE